MGLEVAPHSLDGMGWIVHNFLPLERRGADNVGRLDEKIYIFV